MNHTEVAGFLGADPEERFTANGKRVIELRVAARARKDETIWWRVNIWDDRFDKMLPFLKKGSAVIIYGEMRKPETYTSRDGTTQVSLTLDADCIKFSPFGRSDRPGEGAPRQGGNTPSNQQPVEQQFAAYGAAENTAQTESPTSAYAGDDLPF